jgi:hypothetical protein
MKRLGSDEQAFLDRRRRLILRWPIVLLVLLLLLAGTWLYLYLRYPVLANAAFVVKAVAAGTLSAETLQLSTLYLPLVVTVLFFVVAVLLLFLHLTVRNERRYLAIIRRLRQSPDADSR